MKRFLLKIKENMLLALLFCGMSFLLVVGGVVYYKYEAEKIKKSRYKEIHSLAKLKSDLLSGWLRERQSDILVISESPIYQDAVQRWLENRKDENLKKKLTERLAVVKKRYNYSEIMLVDSLGNVYLTTGDHQEFDQFFKARLRESSYSGSPLHTGIYRCQLDHEIHFDFISQLKNEQEKSDNVFLVFRTNPEVQLFPVLMKWPGVSRSGETIIISRKGDSLVYLSELRFKQGAALNLRVSLDSDSAPLLSKDINSEGMSIGIDYRGKEVLSDISRVPGTDWFLVSKIDTEEIFDDLNFKMVVFAIVGLLGNIVLFMGFAMIYSLNSKTHYRRLYEQEKYQKQKLTDSEEKFSKAFYSSPDAILITDMASGLIVDFNQGLLDLTGYTSEEISGGSSISLKIWKSTEYRDMVVARVLEAGELSNLQIEYLYKDGTTRYGLFSAKQMEFAGQKCLLSVVKDITDRVEMEIELRDAKEKAEELNRAKASFFANMSHELRTPLHGVLGFSEILIEDITDTETLEVVHSIHRSALRLLNTLNLILDLARLEANKEEVVAVNMHLYKAVKDDFETFEAFAKSKGLYLELFTDDPEICAMVDPRFLGSIVNNLINNAIKFTRFGGIRVETGSIEEDGVRWSYLRVTDTGIGISEKAITLIFDEFRQASEGFGRSFEGTGLGLSIVKRYVTLLGGKIMVDSKLGKGTTFTVLLPYCEKMIVEKEISDQTDEYSEGILPAASDKKRKLLLVEDDDASAWFITKVLEKYYEIESVRTGEEGLELISSKCYDAFLLDINLEKGITGVDVAQKISENQDFINIPVVAITAFGSSEQEELLLKSGFSHYISKPFSKKELLTFVNELFEETV